MKGFSLIEVLVVITIGGILLTIAWVRMSTLVPIYRLEGAARGLATEIQKAHGRAVAEGKCIRVTINPGAKTYQVEPSPNSVCSGYVAETARKVDDTDSIAVAVTNNPVFQSRGTLVAGTGSQITLTNSAGDARSVFVQEPSGRVYVQ